MVEFACNSNEMEKGIRTLCDRIVACGGFVEDRLTIGDVDGNFLITAPESVDPKAPIIRVPKDHLLPVDKYTIGIEGDDFVIRDHDKSLPETQVELMEIMLALYNLAGKVPDHRKVCFWQLSRLDPELMNMATSARNNVALKFTEKMEELNDEDFIVESYLKTRVLGVKGSGLELSDIDVQKILRGKTIKSRPAEMQPSMMPLIDFLNHNISAGGYILSDEERSRLSVGKSTIVDGSNECFVGYGYHDALDTLINYNFVDWYSVFVRSIPMQINVPGFGIFNINANGGRANLKPKEVPPKLRDLGYYLPNVVLDENPKMITFSYLLIPQMKAPRSLRRILAFAVWHMSNNHSESELMDCVDYLQDEIINRNLAFYDDLEQKMKDRPIVKGTEVIVDNVKTMIKTQRENILKYPLKGVSGVDVAAVLAK